MLLYKHKDNTDVALEVIKSFYVKEKKVWKLKVRWWNIGSCHAPWCMQLEERIALSRGVWSEDWSIYNYGGK